MARLERQVRRFNASGGGNYSGTRLARSRRPVAKKPGGGGLSFLPRRLLLLSALLIVIWWALSASFVFDQTTVAALGRAQSLSAADKQRVESELRDVAKVSWRQQNLLTMDTRSTPRAK